MKSKKKLNVILSAIWYPLSMATYFRRAFEQRDDIELYTIGPYTEDYIPWNGGMRLPRKYIKSPNYVFAPEFIGKNVPFELIRDILPWKPDLWLQIDAGWHFSTRPDATVVAHIQTDPHVLKEFYKKPKSYSDVNFCMQLVYAENDEKYLPYAYDDTVFYPEDLPKEHDACLIGLQYEQRTKLVERLRQRGMNVYYDIGEVFDEFRTRYNKSKIALNWSSLLDLNCRTFEAFGMGLALLTNRVPDLSNFFVEGDHYLGFNDIDEAEKQALLLLSDEDMAAEMGWAAYRKVKSGHTYAHRVQSILEICKLI